MPSISLSPCKIIAGPLVGAVSRLSSGPLISMSHLIYTVSYSALIMGFPPYFIRSMNPASASIDVLVPYLDDSSSIPCLICV